jgi:hypothetical protein
MAFCTRCRQVMEPMAAVCPACGNDFADPAPVVSPPGSLGRVRNWHFWVLIAGTVLFWIRFQGSAGDIHLREGLRTLGAYVAFLAVLFGHWHMRFRHESD